MTPQTINIITNVIAILLVFLVPVQTYLTTQPFSWEGFIACVLGAAVAWFTGKSTLAQMKKNGTAPKP